MMNDIPKYQKLAEDITVNAGNILLEYKHKFVIMKNKDELLDIATNADYASEQYIVDTIKKYYPSHSILTEETAENYKTNSDYEWIIDPLDGTKEFIRNMPLYCVNISLEYKHKLVLGVIYQPELKRLYSTLLDKQSTLNKIPISVSDQTELKKSLIHLRLADYRMPKKILDRYTKILIRFVENVYRLRSNNWDVESLCYVSSGALEAYVLPSNQEWSPPKWWDLSAGILMVMQAGGMVSDFFGSPIVNRDLSKGLIASNGKIHQNLLQLVKGYHS